MNSSSRAFSLPEVLAVIAVLSVVSFSFIGGEFVRSYQTWQSRQNAVQQLQGLLRELERARVLAISAARPVLLCGGQHCDGDWSKLIYLSYQGDSEHLESYEFEPQTSIRWRGFPRVRPYIVFLPSGLASYQNGSFYVCTGLASEARRIILNQSGRAYLERSTYPAKEC